MVKRSRRFLREGEYAAEVEVKLVTTDEGWSPYLSLEDAERLDAVREALRRGDIRAASREAGVYHLTPVTG